MNTLLNFHKHVHFRAEHGSRGGSANKTGSNGADLFIEVPRGTLVKSAETDEVLADLVQIHDEYVALRGDGVARAMLVFPPLLTKPHV
jgi:GTP-binding protein